MLNGANPQETPPNPVRVTRTGNAVQIDTGSLKLLMGADMSALVDSITVNGMETAQKIVGRLTTTDGETFRALCDEVKVVDQGPYA